MLNKYSSIQTLRAVAALLVVFMHSLYHYDDNAKYLSDPGLSLSHFYYLKPFDYSGVHLFFIISGFVMAMLQAQRPHQSAGSFVFDRISRIVPMYWLMTVVWCFTGYPGNMPTVWHFIQSIAFIPPVDKFPVLGVGWTLNYEMYFYASFALIVILARKSIWWLGALFFGFVCLSLVSNNYLFNFYGAPIVWDFIVGIVILKIHRYSGLARFAPMIFGIGLATMVSSIFYMVPGSFLARNNIVGWGIPCAFVVLGAVAMEANSHGGRVFHIPGAAALGAASYSLYLIHPSAIYYLNGFALYKLQIQNYVGANGAIMLLLAVLALAAVGVNRLIEKPLTRLIRAAFKRSEAKLANDELRAI